MTSFLDAPGGAWTPRPKVSGFDGSLPKLTISYAGRSAASTGNADVGFQAGGGRTRWRSARGARIGSLPCRIAD